MNDSALTSEPTDAPFKTLEELDAALDTPMSDGAWIPRLIATARAFLSRPSEPTDWTEHVKVLRTQADAFCPPHYPGEIPETFRIVARQYREVAAFLSRSGPAEGPAFGRSSDGSHRHGECNDCHSDTGGYSMTHCERCSLRHDVAHLRSELAAAVLQRAPEQEKK